MSKNSKNAKRHVAEKQASQARQNGTKGPAKTTPQHGKKNAWWQKGIDGRKGSYKNFIQGGKKAKREE